MNPLKNPYTRRLGMGFFVAALMRLTDLVSNVFEGTTIMILVVILFYVVNPLSSGENTQ